jgi:hypothetical protein
MVVDLIVKRSKSWLSGRRLMASKKLLPQDTPPRPAHISNIPNNYDMVASDAQGLARYFYYSFVLDGVRYDGPVVEWYEPLFSIKVAYREAHWKVRTEAMRWSATSDASNKCPRKRCMVKKCELIHQDYDGRSSP